jgi:hypothetical protein
MVEQVGEQPTITLGVLKAKFASFCKMASRVTDDRISYTVTEWIEQIVEHEPSEAAAEARGMAEMERLREALVQHNERLRSAQQIASRNGEETNWKAFRGECAYTLSEYHDLVNESRAALNGGQHETQS